MGIEFNIGRKKFFVNVLTFSTFQGYVQQKLGSFKRPKERGMDPDLHETIRMFLGLPDPDLD